jgi:two-component system sensor histidine kinase KdpD
MPTITQRIVASAADIPVHVLGQDRDPGEGEDAAPPPPATRPAAQMEWTPYGVSAFFVASAVGVGIAVRDVLQAASISLVFLTAVLGSAAAFGLWPSLFACLISVLAYNFFFLPPLYTFTIADPENVVALVFFLITAIVASNLAAAVRAQAVTAGNRARTTDDLYQFSRKLAAIASIDDLLWAAVYQVAAMLKVRVVLLLPEGETVAVRAGYPPEDALDEADLAAARWCWQHNRPAGRGSDTLPGGKRLFLPLGTGRGPVAVMGIESDRPGPLLSPDQRRLLDALGDQTAVSIERITLAEDVDRARLLAETERLRSALLTSISHDLRTPLASILGAASSLESYDLLLDQAAKRDLLRTIQEEAERLGRFVANLLDMTRLEAGALAPKREAADLGELVGSALARAGKVLAAHRVEVDIAAGLPLPELDVVLFEQALFNVLDNAAKYAPRGSLVTIRAWHEAAEGELRLQVLDEGDGVPDAALPHLFEKFYRVQAADRQRPGTGLGLAIARGFVEAMGGRVEAGNRTDRPGAMFTFVLPVPRR